MSVHLFIQHTYNEITIIKFRPTHIARTIGPSLAPNTQLMAQRRRWLHPGPSLVGYTGPSICCLHGWLTASSGRGHRFAHAHRRQAAAWSCELVIAILTCFKLFVVVLFGTFLFAYQSI